MFKLLVADVTKELFRLCKCGGASQLEELIESYPYAKSLLEVANSSQSNAKNIAEKTIYTAALSGLTDVVKVLVRAGVSPNAQTSIGTPIYAAAKSGSLEMVQYLIKHGADHKSPRGGFSPLYVACIEGRLQVLRYLVGVGANVFAFSNPPLVFTACTAGQLDILRYLLEETEWDLNRTMTGDSGNKADGKDTLLYTACSRSKLEVAGFLVRHGANITRTIVRRFPQIIKHILQQRFRPHGPAQPVQLYQARLKELGLAELPWSAMVNYKDTIFRLELRGNVLAEVPREVFQMPSLKILDLSENQISVLAQEDVKWTCNKWVWLTGEEGTVDGLEKNRIFG